jgi:hypothetical protein
MSVDINSSSGYNRPVRLICQECLSKGAICFVFINPYEKTNFTNGQWLKANFHTHAGTGRDTCGAYDISDVLLLYKEAGYNILAISNHDIFTNVESYQEMHDLVLLNGFEYSNDPHLLCLNCRSLITGTHQEVVHECREQGGFSVLCHPNWQNKKYWPWEDIDQLKEYTGIEIYNGVIFHLSGSGLATDTWDYLLSQGKLVWGFGNDDFHRWMHLNRAWNVIFSRSRQLKDIQDSILYGKFYVSTGLILNDFVFTDHHLIISASAKNSYDNNNLYRFIGKNGQILDEHKGDHGEYYLSGVELYIRVQIISEHGAMLWTQPIYQRALFKRP